MASPLPLPPAPRVQGALLDILLAPSAGATIQRHSFARALLGVGLADDRYALGEGTWSSRPEWRSEVTLIAIEQLKGVGLSPEQARRNLLTQGLDLEELVGWSLHIGEVVLVAERVCSPCRLLQRRSGVAVRELLRTGGGLRARVVASGMLRRGDTILALPPGSPPKASLPE